MNDKQLQDFVSYLIKNKHNVYSHTEDNGEINIRKINTGKNFELCPKRPLYSFKKFFLPSYQRMMVFKDGNTTLNKSPNVKIVLLGLHFYDLKAFTLINQVYKKDPHFQKKLRNAIVIGQSPIPAELEDYQKFEKEVLEHLKFDIFLEAKSHGKQESFRIFTGSEDGQRLLDDFGYKDYENIEYVGPVPKKGLGPINSMLIEKIRKSRGSKIWKELAEKCTNCGKCSIVCPTCFCFKIEDEIKKDEIVRTRKWDSCFYEEFSQIAGGHKFLDTTEKRIYNWYDHKFVRIPEEYRMPGCVSCGRCTEVCPAGIDIRKVLKRIIREN
ncbi:MAG: 4Fe-4S dicluster domain-containing protein [Candidatus Pacebacteria bacterium]|nr:4Fe-4S dicluster domain-containing protein [Candidatus Paceibacterota bacterium]